MNKKFLIAISLLEMIGLIVFSGCDNHAHTYDRNWKYNETHHWKEPTCGCAEIGEYAEHSLGEDGFCWICNKELMPSQGVEYAVLSDIECAQTVGFWGAFDQEKISVAEWYNGFPVTQIGDFSFDGCDRVTTIVLPHSIVGIGSHAFDGCTALKSIDWKNQVEWIGANAFNGCSNLEELTLPNSVTQIGEFAFANCIQLKVVKIPDGVLEISKGLFLGCSNLTEITIGKGVKKIGESAFAHCSKLSKMKISNGVEEIGKTAFNSCVALKSLICAKTVKVIGERAFYELTEILYYEGDEQEWANVEKADGYMPKVCYYSEGEPSFDEGNGVRYWRYVDGEPTVWEQVEK